MSTSITSHSTREKIFIEILRDLEAGRVVPGQRLAETDLVARFGVGRNAVREGIQLLSERGVVDLTPNRSPAIRSFTFDQAMGVLDVSIVLTGLLARAAAQNFSSRYAARLAATLAEIDGVPAGGEREFSRAQRHFTQVMLDISENMELQRIYPMVGMAIFTAQFRSPAMIIQQKESILRLSSAVTANDAAAAEKAGRQGQEKLRALVSSFF